MLSIASKNSGWVIVMLFLCMFLHLAKLFSYSKIFNKMPPTEATPATTYQATKEHPSTFGQVESAREVADRKCEVVEGLVKLKQFQVFCSKWLRWENQAS